MLKTEEQKNILTPSQTEDYYKSQSGASNPLSPVSFLSSIQGEDDLIATQKKAEKLTPQQYLAEGGALKDGQIPTEKIEPTAKEQEKTGGGYSFDEALQLFGTDFTGLHKLDDGTYEADTTALNRIGIKTDAEQGVEAQQELDTARVDIENLTTKLRNLDISKDPAFMAISQGIQNSWNDRIAQMEQANASRSASMQQLGIRYGSKYTGGSFGTIVSEEERQGMDRVASLENQKVAALANAEVAFRNERWDEYVDLIDLAEKKYDKAVEELNALNEIAIKRNEVLAKEVKEKRDAEEFEWKRTKNVLDNISNSVYNSLTGDSEADMQMLSEIADLYDIDQNMLMDSVLQTQQTEEKHQADISALGALETQRLASAEKSLRVSEPITKTTKTTKDKLDAPLSPTELRTIRDDYGLSTEDLPVGSTMRDVQILQTEKFIEDNADKDPEEVKNAISENTDLEFNIIEKIANSVFRFFSGKETKKTKEVKKPEETDEAKRQKELEDLLNSF